MKRYFSAALIVSLVIAFASPASDVQAYSRYRSERNKNITGSLTSQTLSSSVVIEPVQILTATVATASAPTSDSAAAAPTTPTPVVSTPTTAAPMPSIAVAAPNETVPVSETPVTDSAPATSEAVPVPVASESAATPTVQSPASGRINPIGISTHLNELSYAEIDRQLDLAKTAGVYWVRFDFSWDQMQEDDGSWNFSKYDYIVNGINARGMQTLALLTQYEIERTACSGRGNLTPMTPGEFGAFASKVSEHYKGRVKLYELGNEPNNDIYWNTGVSATAYTKLLIAGDDAIKAQDSSAKTISAGIPPLGNMESFLQGMYDAGAKGHFDYLGYHPYSTHSSPDKDFGDTWLAREIEIKNGDDKPMIATEVGWSTATGGVSEADQATYTGRVYQKIMAEDYGYVVIACTYDFKNDGPSSSDWESNFGMLRYDYSKKPVFAVMQAQRAYYDNHF